MSPWTNDGWDRNDMTPGMEGMDGRGRLKKGAKVPELWEAEVDSRGEISLARGGIERWTDIRVSKYNEVRLS